MDAENKDKWPLSGQPMGSDMQRSVLTKMKDDLITWLSISSGQVENMKNTLMVDLLQVIEGLEEVDRMKIKFDFQIEFAKNSK